MSMALRASQEQVRRTEQMPVLRPPVAAPDARLTARFGVEVLAGGYTAVPNLVLRYAPRLGLSNGELLLIHYIWQHWWPADQPHPSVPTLARAMSKSVRMVRYYLQALRDKGLLLLEERFGSDGNQQSNAYNLQPLIAAVVALAEADGWTARVAGVQQVGDHTLQRVPAMTCTGPLQSLADLKETLQDSSTRENQFDGLKSTGGSNVRRVRSGDMSVAPDSPPESMGAGPSAGATSRRQDPVYHALSAPLQTLSREFGDSAHPRVSLARAHNLLRGAQVGQNEFLGMLEEAAARTRAARSRLSRIDQGTSFQRKNMMPYLFATLEGVLGEAGGARAEASIRRAPPRALPEARQRRESAPNSTAADKMHPVWDLVLAELREVMTAENYRRWLAPTYVISQQETLLIVAVPTELHKLWLGQRLQRMINEALRRTAPAGMMVSYTVEGSGQPG